MVCFNVLSLNYQLRITPEITAGHSNCSSLLRAKPMNGKTSLTQDTINTWQVCQKHLNFSGGKAAVTLRDHDTLYAATAPVQSRNATLRRSTSILLLYQAASQQASCEWSTVEWWENRQRERERDNRAKWIRCRNYRYVFREFAARASTVLRWEFEEKIHKLVLFSRKICRGYDKNRKMEGNY